jgi:hypothetical protein
VGFEPTLHPKKILPQNQSASKPFRTVRRPVNHRTVQEKHLAASTVQRRVGERMHSLTV